MAPHPTFHQAKQDLIDALLACPVMQEPGRRAAMVRELPMAHRISHDSRPDIAVLHIVNACLVYPEGLGHLLEGLRFFEGDSLPMRRVETVVGALLQLGPALLVRAGQVGGTHDETIRVLLEGVAKLPTDYSTRIRNFVVEYLGTVQDPVPFGGRDKELAELDRWLLDSSAPPYTLIAAEAGRGKSSLLVRWAQRLTEQGEVAVIFIPISIRFGTALSNVVFTALAAQLGEVYGELVPWASLSAEEWRGVCQSFLSRTPPDGKTVVVILDGLDEAADWRAGADLFPRQVVPGVRVVVSARYQAGDIDVRGWLRRLGWESAKLARSMTLGQLDRAGLRQVLAAMGNPLDRLVTEVDVIAELHRLSEGDPLLVRLYVLALQAQGEQVASLRPEELRTMDSGLEGYFDRWWTDQRQLWGKEAPLRERAVEALLNLLAGALGPLDRGTLLKLLPPETGITSRTLDDVLTPLSRFVMGDGKEQGYIFNHPRLGYYFWEGLEPEEQEVWEARFLALGRQSLEALAQSKVEPRKAPTYALQYYGAHLERAQAPAEAFFALVNEGWMRAWEAFEGTYAGFLNDVARAWYTADMLGRQRASRPEALSIQVRCALCFASVAALSSNISPSLLVQTLRYDLLTPTQALVITRQIPDEQKRVEMLDFLLSDLPEALLPEVLVTIRGIQEEEDRTRSLGSLALHLPEGQRAEVLQEALTAALALQDEWVRARILESLTPHLPEALLAEVLAAARTIQDEGYRASGLGSLARHLPETQRAEVLQEALSVARTIQNEGSRATSLENLAPHLPEALLPEALAAARTIQDEWDRTRILESLTPHLPEALLAAARAIQEEGARARILESLVLHLPEGQRTEVLQEALSVARTIQDEWGRAISFGSLARHLPETQQAEVLLAEALTAARAIQDEGLRASSLERLAPHLSEALLAEALTAARTIQDERFRASVLKRLAPHLPEALLAEALTAARTIQDKWVRASSLVSLAPHLPEALLAEALTAARATQDEGDRARILDGLAPHLPEGQRAEVLQEALAVARTVQNARGRARILGSLAPHLPEALLPEALTAARAIQDEGDRARILERLAPHLPEALLAEALTAARAIQDEGDRAISLGSLTPHLPEGQQAEVLQEALAAARAIQNEGDRAISLGSLTPHLPEGQRAEVLQEALTAARTVQNEGGRAISLASLAPHLPEVLLPEALAAVCAIQEEEEEDRAHTLMTLVPPLANWTKHSSDRAYQSWCATLHMLAANPRQIFLSDLSSLLPFVLSLADHDSSEVAAEIFHQIQEVCAWWP